MTKKFFNEELYNEMLIGTNIVSGDEYHQILAAIAKVASDMVIKTQGPYGKTTTVDDGSNFTYSTKDGWATLKRLHFHDPIYNILFNVIRQVSDDMANRVGDGTTTALVGANLFIQMIEEYKESENFRQTEFLTELKSIAEEICDEIRNSEYVHRINIHGDFSDIYKVALIASNDNDELASIIQEIYRKTQNPNIYMTLDPGTKLTYEIQDGYKLDCKPLNQGIYKNDDSGNCILREKVKFAVFNHNINYVDHKSILEAFANYANTRDEQIIIVAPHFDDITTNILGNYIQQYVQMGRFPRIMMVQCSQSMQIHRDYVADFALLTNATLFDQGIIRACNIMVQNQKNPEEKIEDALFDVEQYKFETVEDILNAYLGVCSDTVIGKDYLLIQGYEKTVNRNLYDDALNKITSEYEKLKKKANNSTTTLQKDFLNAYQRYTKFTGHMGIIHVGAKSELEKRCLYDSVEDSVLACRSAYENGYIRGCNITTLVIISRMIEHESNIADDLASTRIDILKMLYKLFEELSLSVFRNKYDDGVVRRQTIISYNEDENANEYEHISLDNKQIIEFAVTNDCGYNLVTETFEQEDDCTVINSVSTDIEIINSIISILSLILTSNQFLSMNRQYDRTKGTLQIKEEKKKEKLETIDLVSDAVIDKIDDYVRDFAHGAITTYVNAMAESKATKKGLLTRIKEFFVGNKPKN